MMHIDDLVDKYEKFFDLSLDSMLEVGPKYDSYKQRAKKKGIKFKLNFRHFDAIVKKPCHYCNHKEEGGIVGIDRVDNRKGYTPLNSVPCCWTCNRAKSNMTYKEFQEYLKRFRDVK